MKRELQRDQGLRRVSRVTRWTATGALVSAGVLSIAVAESLPGRSSASQAGRSVTAPTVATPPRRRRLPRRHHLAGACEIDHTAGGHHRDDSGDPGGTAAGPAEHLQRAGGVLRRIVTSGAFGRHLPGPGDHSHAPSRRARRLLNKRSGCLSTSWPPSTGVQSLPGRQRARGPEQPRPAVVGTGLGAAAGRRRGRVTGGGDHRRPGRSHRRERPWSGSDTTATSTPSTPRPAAHLHGQARTGMAGGDRRPGHLDGAPEGRGAPRPGRHRQGAVRGPGRGQHRRPDRRRDLVSLGGDIAVAGRPPAGGWPVRISDDHADPLDGPGPVVAIGSGGLATSTTTVRRWRRGGVPVHHLIDPATSKPASRALAYRQCRRRQLPRRQHRLLRRHLDGRGGAILAGRNGAPGPTGRSPRPGHDRGRLARRPRRDPRARPAPRFVITEAAQDPRRSRQGQAWKNYQIARSTRWSSLPALASRLMSRLSGIICNTTLPPGWYRRTGQQIGRDRDGRNRRGPNGRVHGEAWSAT